MAKSLKLCTLLFGAALIFGCATQNTPEKQTVQTVNAKQFQAEPEPAMPENDARTTKKLVKKAKTAIGTPYVLGGTAPGGFDCSGLVKWAYNSIGVTLPRTAKEQSTVGRKIKKVEDMREGDIVAFRHPKRGYHTGIYVGDGKFVHSPRTRSHVRINSLSDPYFSKTLLGARRIVVGETSNVVAEAESRLEQYLNQHSKLKLAAPVAQAAPKAVKNAKAQAKSKAKKSTAVTSKTKNKTVAASKNTSAKNRKVASNAKKTTVSKKQSSAEKARKLPSQVAKKNTKQINAKNPAKQTKNAKSVAQQTKSVKAKTAKTAKATVVSQTRKKTAGQRHS